MPKVSVIVPVYQVEDYLAECLDSVLSGSFADYEMILVDDGTRDGCPAIMEAYAARDSRISIVHKENGGLSSARNAGLDVARGEYVAFIDSDDRARPGWLADTVAAAERTGAELVLYNYCKFDSHSLYPAELPMRDEVWMLEGKRLADYFYQRWLPYIHGQEAWCRLYRRDVIEAHHLRFEPNDQVFAEDTLFSAMYLFHVRTLCALAEPYIEYRQREDSLMAQPKPRLAWRLLKLSSLLSAYAKEAERAEALCRVLPVLCYDKLICKGIRMDPLRRDAVQAVSEFSEDPEIRGLMQSLHGFGPLAEYTLRTGRGWRTQLRGRQMAAAFLRGDSERVVSLVLGDQG